MVGKEGGVFLRNLEEMDRCSSDSNREFVFGSRVAFVAIGSVAIAVGSSMGPYLDAILQNVKDGLTQKV